jgi:hypothetical protein
LHHARRNQEGKRPGERGDSGAGDEQRHPQHEQAFPAVEITELADRHQHCGEPDRISGQEPRKRGQGLAGEVSGDCRQSNVDDGEIEGGEEDRDGEGRECTPRVRVGRAIPVGGMLMILAVR